MFFKPKKECNICNWKGKRFNSDAWHPYTVCPSCNSKVRQRLFWAAVTYIDHLNIEKILKNKTILHFAPDVMLRKVLSTFSENYKTADYLAEGYAYKNIDYHIDISDMRGIKDETFDFIIAFDVLEYVVDHSNAVKEIYRVLNTGGFCAITIPQKDNLELTYEDPSITDPTEREKAFGQKDHLRIYGSDFRNLIEAAGFQVIIIDEKSFPHEIAKEHVLFSPVLSPHPLATNYRKIYFGKK